MQAKPGHFHDLGESVILFPGRNGLQREYPAPLLRTDGNAITDRATQYLLYRVFGALFARERVHVEPYEDSHRVTYECGLHLQPVDGYRLQYLGEIHMLFGGVQGV